MLIRRLVIVMPLLVLAACTGNPQAQYTPLVSRDAGRSFPQAAPVVPRTSQDMTSLKGLKSPEVASIFGKPGFTRRDAPAEVWSYRGRACTLDVFLYDEGSSQTVAHYAVRSAQAVTESECFNELAGQGRPVPAG